MSLQPSKDRTFWISLIGFLLIMEGVSWWIGSIVPFTEVLKLQMALLGPKLHSWLLSERSIDTIYLIFYKNPVVLLFGGLLLMVTGAGLIMLKKWARWLLMAESSGLCVMAAVLIIQGGKIGAGIFLFWGAVLVYASGPGVREIFRLGWQDHPPVDARSQ